MNAEIHVLLIVGGGIAAYKSIELTRQLRKSGASITPILTNAAHNFVTPLSMASVADGQIRQSLFDPNEELLMDHIQLSRQADIIVVAPATADLLAKMANGLADDLASTVLLATDKPVLASPAMNVRMWLHPATQRNVLTLQDDGVHFIGPNVGEMACGETGPGRMSEPQEISDAIMRLCTPKPLAGKSVIVTSGPTWEYIDPVRVIANRSSGRQGTEIAKSMISMGADVTFITGPTCISPPIEAKVVQVESAKQMLKAVEHSLPVDVAIFAAAVTDWKPETVAKAKLKKTGDQALVLNLKANPDILAAISKRKKLRPQLVIGFAAETEDIIKNAKEKLQRKGCDWIVANDVSHKSGILGGEENQPIVISAKGEKRFPRISKSEFAGKLGDMIVEQLDEL